MASKSIRLFFSHLKKFRVCAKIQKNSDRIVGLYFPLFYKWILKKNLILMSWKIN